MAEEYDPMRGAGEGERELKEDDDDPTRGAGERIEDDAEDEDAPGGDPMRGRDE